MILVDVYVPALNQVFDFNLDENAKIEDLLDEMGEMVEQNSRSNISGKGPRLMLCSYDGNRILPLDSTLFQCEIRNGSRLLMV